MKRLPKGLALTVLAVSVLFSIRRTQRSVSTADQDKDHSNDPAVTPVVYEGLAGEVSSLVQMAEIAVS